MVRQPGGAPRRSGLHASFSAAHRLARARESNADVPWSSTRSRSRPALRPAGSRWGPSSRTSSIPIVAVAVATRGGIVRCRGCGAANGVPPVGLGGQSRTRSGSPSARSTPPAALAASRSTTSRSRAKSRVSSTGARVCRRAHQHQRRGWVRIPARGPGAAGEHRAHRGRDAADRRRSRGGEFDPPPWHAGARQPAQVRARALKQRVSVIAVDAPACAVGTLDPGGDGGSVGPAWANGVSGEAARRRRRP